MTKSILILACGAIAVLPALGAGDVKKRGWSRGPIKSWKSNQADALKQLEERKKERARAAEEARKCAREEIAVLPALGAGGRLRRRDDSFYAGRQGRKHWRVTFADASQEEMKWRKQKAEIKKERQRQKIVRTQEQQNSLDMLAKLGKEDGPDDDEDEEFDAEDFAMFEGMEPTKPSTRREVPEKKTSFKDAMNKFKRQDELNRKRLGKNN